MNLKLYTSIVSAADGQVAPQIVSVCKHESDTVTAISAKISQEGTMAFMKKLYKHINKCRMSEH